MYNLYDFINVVSAIAIATANADIVFFFSYLKN